MPALHAGIGLRQPHYQALLAAPPPLAFVEVHSENFFGDGGAALAVLDEARSLWPVSLHGVNLSLGSAAGIDPWHLGRLAALVQRVQPVRVSDHAAFGRALLASPAAHTPCAAMLHANDLLPLAFTDAALDILAANVQRVQDRLQRSILVENLSAYLHWADDHIAESDFFNALTRRTGCGLLLDVNNLVVNALNAERDPNREMSRDQNRDMPRDVPRDVPRDMTRAVQAACAWVDRIDAASVGEIHLAGYLDAGDIVIDDHGSRVHAPVWQVFRHTLARLGPRPTLVEWDTDLPAPAVLLAEAAQAEALLAAAAAAA